MKEHWHRRGFTVFRVYYDEWIDKKHQRQDYTVIATDRTKAIVAFDEYMQQIEPEKQPRSIVIEVRHGADEIIWEKL